ncbi:MAG: ABC transporter ATP-binding protein, partial [Atopobium sp.]|nr:ABC transporter ATP-binding protein [Atopobium sp.]
LVQKAFDTIMNGRTSLVVAHRLSTIQGADCILVLKDGSILERGTHDELIAKHGEYYQLYTGSRELE